MRCEGVIKIPSPDARMPLEVKKMDLREYEQSKFTIAEILRSASDCMPERATALRERLQPLFARLAEDRFNLVVVGRFNRGKTSLMNAILGSDRLPTGILPLTSVITTVGYGSEERVILKFRNRVLDREIPIDALPQHITQQGNPGNVQRITTVEIQLPAEILRRGFYFVDTPGLGSVIVENTLTTQAFLPEADAFIMVTSYESPLSEEELRFFKTASNSGRHIFVVLNKQDTVSADQRDSVFGFVHEQLSAFFGSEKPPIFSVSSIDGLQAKLSGDTAKLAASGISALETHLANFLLSEKSNQFLLRMCDRTREFLHELPSSTGIKKLVLELGALGRKFGDNSRANVPRLTGPLEAFPDLHKLPTCEICAQIADRLWDFLCKYQYEIVINDEERKRFANRGGLCPFHTWQLQSVASPYGMCVGYPPLLDRLATEFHAFASDANLTEISMRIASLVPNEEECAVCNIRNSAEDDAIVAVARRLKEHPERAMNSLSALCLSHIVRLASAIEDLDLVRSLLKRHSTILQRYAEDMRRYAVKHDATRRYLASLEETTAAERSLLLVTGRRQVNFLPRRGCATRADEIKPV